MPQCGVWRGVEVRGGESAAALYWYRVAAASNQSQSTPRCVCLRKTLSWTIDMQMSTYLIRLAFALLIVIASSHWASAQSNLRPSVSNPKNLREMGPASPIDDDCASAERFLQREYERQFPGSTFNADRIAADRRMGCENMKSKARLMGWKDANTRRRDALDREFDDRMAAQKAEWQNQWNDQQRQLQQIWSPQPIITLPRFPTELPPLRVPAQIFSPDWISSPDEPHLWDIPPDFEHFGAEQALNPSNHYFPGVDDQWHPDSVSPHAVPVPAKPIPINRSEHEAWHDLADRLLDTFEPEADARAWDALLNSPQQPANSNSPTSPWDALDAISASPSETYSPELV